MTRGRIRVCAAALSLAALAAAGAARAQASATSVTDAIASGRLIFGERLRYEGVDQAGLVRRADALTLRTRLGWETGAWKGLKGALEFEDVRHVGAMHYNTTVNGRTAYPVVNDPDVTELDRLQLTWAPIRALTATVGRQRINLDDQRFIGSVQWRQDDQTMDAARLDGGWGRFKANYIYLDRINRVVAQAADWRSSSHAFAGYYTASEALKAEVFVFALDLKPVPALSSETVGGRVGGHARIGPYGLDYAAAYADQKNYGANPGRYHLPYWMAEAAGSFGIYQLKVNYESLGGDGVRGFSTPLATLHLFQGWADAFTTTPARGVQDLNLSATVAPRWTLAHLAKPALFVRYHDFQYARGGGGLGQEWDASAQAALSPRLVALLKYAGYRGVPGFPSRQKVWLQLDYSF